MRGLYVSWSAQAFNAASEMDQNDSHPPLSMFRRPISSQLACVHDEVLQRCKDLQLKLKWIEENWKSKVVPPQTAENIGDSPSCRDELQSNDANDQPKGLVKGNSTSFEDPENKKPENTPDNLNKSRDDTGPQRKSAIWITANAGSSLRNTAKKKDSVEVKIHVKDIIWLMIGLGILSLLPGTKGNGVQVQYITKLINQSVTLPADAKQEDFVEWSVNPADDPKAYFPLSGEIPREDGCTGYEFTQDHSIVIKNVQPCHAGTYIVEIKRVGIDSKSIVLIVNDTAEASTEANTVTDATTNFHSPEPKDNTTVIAIVFTIVGVVLLAVVLVIGTLYLSGKFKGIWNKGPSDASHGDGKYQVVEIEEDVQRN